ncbi:MAG: 3-phosphoshikimate 1-carboxyvinyltransferase [Oscillospiraceae bacterium]
MEKVQYSKGAVGGEISLPPSKSVAHRALLCAALSGGCCNISPIENSGDMQATFHFIRAMGAELLFDESAKQVEIKPGKKPENCTVNCLESGSTLRFVIPILAAMGIPATFTGGGRLPERPIGIYGQILHGVHCVGEGLPFHISGTLESGRFDVPGNISSQFITGLLLALPLLSGNSEIHLSTKLESESYVNLTLDVMKDFGVEARKTEYGYFIYGNQKYCSRDYEVEADWSHAAFFLSMAAFTKEKIILRGLRQNSPQGDRAVAALFAQMGVSVALNADCLTAWNPHCGEPFHGLHAIAVNASDIPDLVPPLAITAALCQGETVISHAARLRLKESDRLKALCGAIAALGGSVRETEDGLVLQGVKMLSGGQAFGCSDHRIVMSMAAAASASQAPVTVTEPWSIRKSYPGFFSDYGQLGGVCHVLNMGQ